MKYLKRFCEDQYQYSWAGSSLAFKNPEVFRQSSLEDIPKKLAYGYECLDCQTQYLHMKEDGVPVCPVCGCSDSKSVTIKDNF